MEPALTFDVTNGAVSVEGTEVVLSPEVTLSTVEKSLSQFSRGKIDHRNGYEWLYFKDLSLDGYSCGLALCFLHGALTEVHWEIVMPDVELKESRPTRQSIAEEIRIMRGILSKALGRGFSAGREHFPWGTVWCLFDANGVRASSGLRYSG